MLMFPLERTSVGGLSLRHWMFKFFLWVRGCGTKCVNGGKRQTKSRSLPDLLFFRNERYIEVRFARDMFRHEASGAYEESCNVRLKRHHLFMWRNFSIAICCFISVGFAHHVRSGASVGRPNVAYWIGCSFGKESKIHRRPNPSGAHRSMHFSWKVANVARFTNSWWRGPTPAAIQSCCLVQNSFGACPLHPLPQPYGQNCSQGQVRRAKHVQASASTRTQGS